MTRHGLLKVGCIMNGLHDLLTPTGSSDTYTLNSETTLVAQRFFERVLDQPSMLPTVLYRIHSRLLSSDRTSEETLALLSLRWTLVAECSSSKKSSLKTLDYKDILNKIFALS